MLKITKITCGILAYSSLVNILASGSMSKRVSFEYFLNFLFNGSFVIISSSSYYGFA